MFNPLKIFQKRKGTIISDDGMRPDGTYPTCVFVIGIEGCGKTEWLKRYIKPQPVIVERDNWENLHEYDCDFIMESYDQLDTYIKEKKDFIYETRYESIPLARMKIKSAGYALYMVWILEPSDATYNRLCTERNLSPQQLAKSSDHILKGIPTLIGRNYCDVWQIFKSYPDDNNFVKLFEGNALATRDEFELQKQKIQAFIDDARIYEQRLMNADKLNVA